MSLWRLRLESLKELTSSLERALPELETADQNEAEQLAELEAQLQALLTEHPEISGLISQSGGFEAESAQLEALLSQQSTLSMPTVAERLAKPGVTMAQRMGEDLTTNLLEVMKATGFPGGYQIRKTSAGQWGVFTDKAVHEPIVYAQDREYKGFQFCMAVVAAFWCADAVFTGELDERPVSDSVLAS